ncbi:MAG: glycosyltransferase family 2 protein [Planctomycetes bacterium]|nr:glycosyltransferase family 2 protein [Planctomycetota bacterium]MCB9870233.1 glycosyltransferase family 2 protein [Planctomycetota bacterium]
MRDTTSAEPEDPAGGPVGAPVPHIAVVIPVFRAEAHIAKVLRGIPPFVRTIVAVDDQSPDRSIQVIGSVDDPRIHCVRLPHNLGVGGATLAGYCQAVELGAEVMVKMDADDQMDPLRLPELLGPILDGSADYTKGNRFIHAQRLDAMPLVRRLGNVGLSFLSKLASGYWGVFDPTNGFTALHARAFGYLDQKAIARRYFFETSMLVELSLAGAVVRDVYIPARYGDEQSSLSPMRSLLGFPPRLLRGFVRRIWVHYFVRDFGLLSLFLIAGLCLLSYGAVFGISNWVYYTGRGEGAPLGTIMLSVLSITLGAQFILQAILLDVQSAPVEPLQRGSARLARTRARLTAAVHPEVEIPRPSRTATPHPAPSSTEVGT